jgi:hypothetical protein
MSILNGAKCGGPIIVVYSDCIIDGHSHIMSGYCTPLPLLWKQAPFGLDRLEASRTDANFSAGTRLVMVQIDKTELDRAKAIVAAQEPDATDDADKKTLQACSTEVIGTVAVFENRKAFGPNGSIAKSDEHRFSFVNLWSKDGTKKREDFTGLFTIMIALPMDMEYAHLAGFEHQPIYYEKDGVTYVVKRTSVYQKWEELKKEVLPVDKEDIKKFNKWKVQYTAHKKAAQNNPWSILPFYHYEPRRWYQKSKTEDPSVQDLDSMQYGAWDRPFDDIASRKESGKPGIFIGMKMYTPLGYNPADTEKLPHLSKYYTKCIQEDIPILAHCSLGGITTHEYDLFRNGEQDEIRKEEWSWKPGKATRNVEMDYFENAFVHPRHWKTVLKMPGNGPLRLCLAHFGGSIWGEHGLTSDWITTIIDLLRWYPNVYTDISCFDIAGNEKHFIEMLKDPNFRDIHKKIIFGTDWYMTLMAKHLGHGIAIHYKHFVESFKKTLDKNKLQHLWPVMTLVNPVRFLGLDNGVLVENMKNYFTKVAKLNKTQLALHETNYLRMKALGEEAKKVRDKVNQGWGGDYLP